MTVVTRFAPSPTGYLHIGGARTALFSWLFARHHGGKYILRVEDTDQKRSTQDAIDKIIEGLSWLGIDHDGDVIFQSQNADRHAKVAEQLLAEGKAYKCYCSPEELTEMREKVLKNGTSGNFYNNLWRDRDPSEAPAGIDPVLRIKMPLAGETSISDLVQGDVTRANNTLDDFVIMRSDGTPTYMLAVVVDDHDIGATHVIRGDDHLNNAFRQFHLYNACGWHVPEFAHIPLIHGADGAKMSKRHGALGVDHYAALGILPETMRNYLLRLGWSHGDDETISTEQAIEWFGLDAVGRSPARFDMDRILNLNSHYLKEADPSQLSEAVLQIARETSDRSLSDSALQRLESGISGLVQRAKTITEVVDLSNLYLFDTPLKFNDKAREILTGEDALKRIFELAEILSDLTLWDESHLNEAVREYADTNGLKLGQVAQPLRAALAGSNVSPGIFEVMVVLGRNETLERLKVTSL
ncbi:MAG: glutamate--tRNA ligase [Alphaproteobacteria bacterium]|nr:glutamate--tRNA ligase [Alphaproteobacteria bacterium]